MRRLPGETSGEKLTQNTFKMADCLTTRHDIGGVGDTDKGTPGAVIKSGIIGVCTTAAATVNKVVQLSNFSDFELLPGMEILVFFKYGNTASNPTLNVYGTGAKLIKLENQASGVSVGSGAWEGGTWQRFQYAKVTVDETVYDNWLMIGNNIAQKTSSYTIYADGRIEYGKQTHYTGETNGVNRDLIYDIVGNFVHVRGTFITNRNTSAWWSVGNLPIPIKQITTNTQSLSTSNVLNVLTSGILQFSNAMNSGEIHYVDFSYPIV